MVLHALVYLFRQVYRVMVPVKVIGIVFLSRRQLLVVKVTVSCSDPCINIICRMFYVQFFFVRV